MQIKKSKIILIVIYGSAFLKFNHLICSENLLNRDTALKQCYENGQWIDETKSLFYYDPSNQLSSIEYYQYQNNNWENDIIITYFYNDIGQLEERKEIVVNTGELLSHESYQYNGQGQLTRISFPDVPWYQTRNFFGIRTSEFSDIIRIDPYIITSHLQNIRYTYDNSGKIKRIYYHVVSDSIPSSIEFFPADNSNRPHPRDIIITTDDMYESTIQSYINSLRNIYPLDEKNTGFADGKYTYVTNGNQLSVIYEHPFTIHIDPYHRAWSFYEFLYPLEMRTIQIYSSNTDSNFKASPQIGHINPQKEILPFKDMLMFWQTKLNSEDQVLLPIDFTGTYNDLGEAYFNSKIEKSLSLNNYYIPGNFYNYFYEPRFQSSYPVQDKKIIKTIELYRLNLVKLDSPIYYGISWDYRSVWINYIERNYEYDDFGQLQRSIIKRWEWDKINNKDPNSGQWENDSKYEFQYNELDYCIQINCFIWDSESNCWKNLFRTHYTYVDTSNGESEQTALQIQMSNYPNPFNTATHVQFLLPEPSEVSLKVYDITGKLIQTILSKEPLSGQHHTLQWDGRNSEGETVSSGMYLFQLEIGDRHAVEKCLYLK